MGRRTPVQKRSRERVDQILAAAAELLHKEGVDAMTTRAISARSGIPVATIYQYFSNREAIIDAFLDRELARVDQVVASTVLELDRVSIRTLAESVNRAHLEYHQTSKMSPVWFSGRRNRAVTDRVENHLAQVGRWLDYAVRSAGFVKDTLPDFTATVCVRLFDRAFEVAFGDPEAGYTFEQREAIVMSVVEMTVVFFERYATVAGIEGISPSQFLEKITDGAAEPDLPQTVRAAATEPGLDRAV